MSGAETCATNGCNGWPQFPDTEGELWCRECYDEPNGGTFEHVEPTNYRSELQERYDR